MRRRIVDWMTWAGSIWTTTDVLVNMSLFAYRDPRIGDRFQGEAVAKDGGRDAVCGYGPVHHNPQGTS
jgi:hypothetical protein